MLISCVLEVGGVPRPWLGEGRRGTASPDGAGRQSGHSGCNGSDVPQVHHPTLRVQIVAAAV